MRMSSLAGYRMTARRWCQDLRERDGCVAGERGGPAGVARGARVIVASEQQRAGRVGGTVKAPTMASAVASAVARTLDLLHPRRSPGQYGSASLLKHGSSRPALVQVSHSRAVAGSMVDGHGVNGVHSPASANKLSGAAQPNADGAKA